MGLSSLIRRPAVEAQRLLDQIYSSCTPLAGTSLDQAGLRDGLAIVEDYLSHGEAGVALEHLIYMVSEPPLKLSEVAMADLCQAADLLGLSEVLADHLAV